MQNDILWLKSYYNFSIRFSQISSCWLTQFKLALYLTRVQRCIWVYYSLDVSVIFFIFICIVKLKFLQAKCYRKQLFCGLDYCHRQGIQNRGIIGSNLLLDKKIAYFGLANFYNPHQVRPQTNRAVTLWYRPPELLLGATCYSSAVDL